MSDPMDTVRDILYPGRGAPVTPINDDIQNAGDNLRDLIDTDLIINDPPADGWTPNPEEVATEDRAGDRHLLVHFFCRTCGAEGNRAICGYQLVGPETDREAECAVCVDLTEASTPFCPNCGVDWRLPPTGVTS